MRVLGFSLAIAAFVISPSFAAPGDQWILGIHHLNNQGDKPFTTYSGGGYSGPQSSGNSQYTGNAYGYSSTGAVGVNRVYWELSGNSVNNNAPVPTTAELFKIEYFAPTLGGHNSYQPVESQFHGIVGEGYPYEPSVPWPGQFSTNHQWISVGNFNDGQWHTMGPGPQTDTSSPANGTMMWLTSGSWLYAKWDFPFAVNRSWSALRLTQITPVAGPPVAGDYNKNGSVDAADYTIWRKTYGAVGANLPADGFPDGFVDEYDYDVWREAFGNHNGSGTGDGLSSLAAVPEPATIGLIVMAAAVCVVVPRRRSSPAPESQSHPVARRAGIGMSRKGEGTSPGKIRSSSFWILALLLVTASLVSCGRKSGPIAQEQTNLSWLGQMYGKYISQNSGKPPKTVDDFRKFVEKKTSAERLTQLKVANVSELFVSPRDGKPFTMVSYEKVPAMKVGEPPPIVLYETEGRDGRRAIALLGGITRTVEDAEVQKLVPAQAKRIR